METYLPESLRQRPASPLAGEKEDEEAQCLSILRLLRETRRTKNVDLLGHLAFGLNRWDSVRYFVDRLLENVWNLRVRHPVPNRLPSNIDWMALPVQNRRGPDRLGRISWKNVDIASTMPVNGARDGFTAADFANSFGPAASGGLSSSAIQDMTLEQLWQSLGTFILEAADLPGERSLDAMEHVYEVLARFQQLDLIPSEVYNAAPSEGVPRSRSRAGMPYLQDMIMHVLADASLGARPAGSSAVSQAPDPRARRKRVRMRKRDLDAGNWLELVLWCCIEGGLAREGAWLLDQMQRRSIQWKVKSWNLILQSTGPPDPRRMGYFDTWAECGLNATDYRLFSSRKPFLGMGERTLTSEVVVATMDGLMNHARADQDGEENSPSDIWPIIASLRTMLKRDGLYFETGDVNHLHARVIESNAITLDQYPAPPMVPLEQAPCVMSEEEGDGLSNSASESPAVDHGHGASTLVLGLHSYFLNIDAALGYISRALGKFETLLGSIDSDKVLEMRLSGLKDKHLIDAPPVRDTKQLRRQLFGEEIPGFFPEETISLMVLNPISLSLLFDALTASKDHRLGHWLLSAKNDDMLGVIPNSMISNPLFAPALIRFAADTNNRHLFSSVTMRLKTPLPREVLKAMVTYQVQRSNWNKASTLLHYLPERQDCHWGATNVASIAAAIIKISERRALGNLITSEHLRKEHVDRAQGLLASVLQGKFDRMVRPSERPYRYQEEQLWQIHRILCSIPGSLGEVGNTTTLRLKRHHNPPDGVPVNAFHHVLAAIVEAHGSLAGKRLWSKWCMDPFGRLAKRIRIGPNAISRQSDNLAFRISWKKPKAAKKGDWSTSQLGKPVLPNLKSVRIIAMRAIEEQRSIWRGYVVFSSESRKFGVLDVLNWSIDMFKNFGLTELEINKELDGQLARIMQELANRESRRFAVGFPRATQLIPVDTL